ncbi:MAG: hypothetical protein LUG94_03320 [Ruminococcus sp.]|nr:hypothetical protein [Ruminococcus sp.]
MSEKTNVQYEVENVVKEFSIDVNRFVKVLEEKSKDIIDDVFYSFVDISKYVKVSLNCIYDKLDDRFKNYLSKGVTCGELSWEDFLSYIYKFAPNKDNSVYLIISGSGEEDYSVVYDGEISEVVKVLFYGVPLGNNGDFTIVSKYYDWLIYYHDDKERLCYVTTIDT